MFVVAHHSQLIIIAGPGMLPLNVKSKGYVPDPIPAG